MNDWMTSAEQVGRLLLGNPGSAVQLGVLLVLGVLTLLFVLGKAGSAFGISNTSFWHSLVVGVLGIVLVVVAMVAVKLYVPLWETASLRVWLLVGAGVIVSLALIVPLMCMLQKAGYFAALFTWLVSVAAAALVIAMVGAAFNAVSSGKRSAEQGREHKKQVESLLD